MFALKPRTRIDPSKLIGRSSIKRLSEARKSFLDNGIAHNLTNYLPDIALVLDRNRQIISANAITLRSLKVEDLETILGYRPGEAVSCIHATEGEDGCGTSAACASCGAVNAIVECLRTRKPVAYECCICTNSNGRTGMLELLVSATHFKLGNRSFLLVVLKDISDQKRRHVLERVFFHDLINSLCEIQGLSTLLLEGDFDQPETETAYKHDLVRLSEQVAEEITAHRQLLAAENGALLLSWMPISVPEIVEGVISTCRYMPVFDKKTLSIGLLPPASFDGEPSIIRRILVNLIKNAAEASGPGETVTVSAQDTGDAIVFSIHNPGFIPEHIQSQIFQRSFSTKGGTGRGIGTYSVKLFAEGYLGGKVGFRSSESEGTVFTVQIPKKKPEEKSA